MTDMDKKLKALCNKHLIKEIYEYSIEARGIIDDIIFLQELVRRNKISKRFTFEILPSFQGCIHNRFVKKLFYNYDQSWWLQEERMIERLVVYDLCNVIINNIYHDDEGNWSDVDLNKIDVLFELRPVVKYFTEIDIFEEIDNFCGSSHTSVKIHDYIKSKEQTSQ
jgi:hypothetical protein